MVNAENKLTKVHPETDIQKVTNVIPIQIYGPNYAEDEVPEENVLPNDVRATTNEEVAPTTPQMMRTSA